MIDVQSQPGFVLAVVSVACLAGVFALCLRCRKKSNMQQEDNDLYDQDVFDQDCRLSHCQQLPSALISNQTQRQTPSMSRQATANRPVKSEIDWSYQNLPQGDGGIIEATYVHPIANALYVNEDDTENLNTGTYENIFPTKVVKHDSDSSSYENADFLAQKCEEEEPDYVNAV